MVVGNDFKDLFGDWRPDEEGRGQNDDLRSEPENRTRRALNKKKSKSSTFMKLLQKAAPARHSTQPLYC